MGEATCEKAATARTAAKTACAKAVTARAEAVVARVHPFESTIAALEKV